MPTRVWRSRPWSFWTDCVAIQGHSTARGVAAPPTCTRLGVHALPPRPLGPRARPRPARRGGDPDVRDRRLRQRRPGPRRKDRHVRLRGPYARGGGGALRGTSRRGPGRPRPLFGRDLLRGLGPEGVRAGRAGGRRAEGPGGDGGPEGARRVP